MDPNATRIARYFELATAPDLEPYYAQFSSSAVVEDEGREHHGDAAIRAWRREVPPVRYSVREQVASGESVRVVARISGEFPGSPVDLTFTFGFAADGRIDRLTIRP